MPLGFLSHRDLPRLSCLPRETDLVHFTGVAKAYGVECDLPCRIIAPLLGYLSVTRFWVIQPCAREIPRN